MPGAGVVRDGARALVLCAPLLAVLVAEGVRVLATKAPRERVARAALAVGAVLLPVALLPGLALGVGHRIEPADYPAAYDEARRPARRTVMATCWCCPCPATGRPPGTTGTWCSTRSAAT